MDPVGSRPAETGRRSWTQHWWVIVLLFLTGTCSTENQIASYQSGRIQAQLCAGQQTQDWWSVVEHLERLPPDHVGEILKQNGFVLVDRGIYSLRTGSPGLADFFGHGVYIIVSDGNEHCASWIWVTEWR
jgi:hypothetical protein